MTQRSWSFWLPPSPHAAPSTVPNSCHVLHYQRPAAATPAAGQVSCWLSSMFSSVWILKELGRSSRPDICRLVQHMALLCHLYQSRFEHVAILAHSAAAESHAGIVRCPGCCPDGGLITLTTWRPLRLVHILLRLPVCRNAICATCSSNVLSAAKQQFLITVVSARSSWTCQPQARQAGWGLAAWSS